MLMLLGICLAFTFYVLINHKVRYRAQRRKLGRVLIITGFATTVYFDQSLQDFYVWGFAAVWFTGLELWFNCEKYGGNYP